MVVSLNFRRMAESTKSRPRGPLSLEDLLKKKEEENEAKSRPVFLTKAQRQDLALQRRREEVESQKKTTERMHRAQEFQVDATRARLYNGKHQGNNGNVNHRNRGEEERQGRERQRELERIKQQYLGVEQTKRKAGNKRNRNAFVFNWDNAEDTSGDVYDRSHEATLLFGRGMRAGMDRREQKKVAAKVVTEAIKKSRSLHGESETGDDLKRALERAVRADRYDGADMSIAKHWSEKSRSEMTERDWRIFREDYNISFKGNMSQETLPVRTWNEAEIPHDVAKAIQDAGYNKPSPIQMAAIPIGLRQRDVIGVAETGSGKTAAFVIPMLNYIRQQPVMRGNPDIEAEGPYAIVLAPTRELAQQIESETRKLAKYTGYRVVSVVGGKSIEDQGFELRKGCEIVVATPGRLLDCIKRRYAVLNQCNYVVLDEADRMIDMGFEPEVMGILDAMPSSNLKPENDDEILEADKVYRTTYMFSATMPPAVEKLAKKYLRRPVTVTIGNAGRATDNVSQRVLMMKENEKPNRLEQELEIAGDAKTIVFANTHRKCEVVTRQLQDLGYSVAMLHGGKSQDQREENIHGFRTNKYEILVATDVAGRGIDVPDVTLVINYDMPHTVEAYTHRIGRTGRAGKKGDSVTFLTHGDSDLFYDFKTFLESCNARVPTELARHGAAKTNVNAAILK